MSLNTYGVLYNYSTMFSIIQASDKKARAVDQSVNETAKQVNLYLNTAN